MKKAYHIGYVQGTFDLFHVGHLNLLKRAKERCEYLLVGIVTDELNQQYKQVKPYIPWEDRAEIVKAIKYVDQVIKIGIENEDKILLWEQYHYDCHFCGDDHNGWDNLIIELGKRGATVEFFPYTQKISSTKIKEDLGKKSHDTPIKVFSIHKEERRIVLYGAGKIGTQLYEEIKNKAGNEIVLWIDKNYEVLRKRGLPISPLCELEGKDYDELVIAVRDRSVVSEIKRSLLSLGVVEEKIFWGS